MNDTAVRQQPELSPLERLSAEYALPAIDLETFAPQPEALRLVHRSIARKLRVVPLSRVGSTITVVMTEPNLSACDMLRFATGLLVEIILTLPDAIEAALDRFYPTETEMEVECPEIEQNHIMKVERQASALIEAAMRSSNISKHAVRRGNVGGVWLVETPTETAAELFEAALRQLGGK
jgi:hypothetical protein